MSRPGKIWEVKDLFAIRWLFVFLTKTTSFWFIKKKIKVDPSDLGLEPGLKTLDLFTYNSSEIREIVFDHCRILVLQWVMSSQLRFWQI